MNKIIIDKEEIKLQRITKKINVSYEARNNIFGITKVKISANDSCDIEIYCLIENSKIDIILDIEDNTNINIYEYTYGDKGKVQYTYNLKENSNVVINKYNKCSNIREMSIVNLNNNNCKFNYIFKSIANTKDIYDICINHNSSNTNSIFNNSILCLNPGRVQLQITHNIDDKINKCNIISNSTIINRSIHQCEIKPNIYSNSYNNIIETNSNIIYDSDEDINLFLLSNLNNRKICSKIKKDIKNIGGDNY